MGMDKKNRIFTFDTIGWSPPGASSTKSAIKWLKNLKFTKNLYPDNLMDKPKPPSCVFVPDKELMQTMIEACIDVENIAELLSKFGD